MGTVVGVAEMHHGEQRAEGFCVSGSGFGNGSIAKGGAPHLLSKPKLIEPALSPNRRRPGSSSWPPTAMNGRRKRSPIDAGVSDYGEYQRSCRHLYQWLLCGSSTQ